MRYLAFLLVLSFTLYSCKPSAKEAISYSDKVSVENSKISEKYDKLLESYNEYDPKEMDAAYDDVKKQVEESLNAMKKLPDFDGKSTFKQGAVDLFNVYSSILNNEHKRIIELLKLPENEYKEKEKNEYEALRNAVNKKTATATEKLQELQKKFLEPYSAVELVKEK